MSSDEEVHWFVFSDCLMFWRSNVLNEQVLLQKASGGVSVTDNALFSVYSL